MEKVSKLMLSSVLSLAGCVAAADAPADDDFVTADRSQALKRPPSAPLTIDERRSLVVTELPILARFTFQRVMDQLVSQAKVPGLTSTKLFQQWWDTQNPRPGVMAGEHCDDLVDTTLAPVFNGFPYSCRSIPSEGSQASCDPFTNPACAYIPVGLFNRFDLAPEDGAHCGEYRIVFAKTTGQTNSRDRNLLIFEGAVPNPEPKRGLEGCRSIARFWADLSSVPSLEERASRLEKFYFKGLGSRGRPVFDIRNYGDNKDSFGQVRTNQFMQDMDPPRQWSLREFKLRKKCVRSGKGKKKQELCNLTFDRDTNKTNPFGPLFAPSSTRPEAGAFQDSFVDQVPNLAAADLSGITLRGSDRFNSAQSQASGSDESRYTFHFRDGDATRVPAGEFVDALEERLDEMDSSLTPLDIVERALTQSCAGCHRLSNDKPLGNGLTWPASLGFTHVTETGTETVEGVTRFLISPALTTTFLPHRKEILVDYLYGRHSKRRGYGSVH